ncbi:sulfotransferase family protein [Pseudomonadales bacterium]|nr:sulfotransferase family protein [Pseudomonadales bacterium]
MISDKYKCLFVHIPKTAGTSIEKLLGHFEELDYGVQDHRTLREIEAITLSDLVSLTKREGIIPALRDLRGFLRYPDRLTQEELSDYFSFAFVRNPWARIHSWYRSVTRDKYFQRTRKISADCTFDDFLIEHTWHSELRPQLTWLKNRQGELGVKYIAKFENIEEEIQIIGKRLRLPSKELPHLLKRESIDYRKYYTDSSIKFVYELYAEEIEMFGYSFD